MFRVTVRVADDSAPSGTPRRENPAGGVVYVGVTLGSSPSLPPSLPASHRHRYNLACHRLETLLQNIDLPPLNSANNAQYFLRKPDKAVEEDQRVFLAYQDCIQLQLQLNLAHHAVQRLRVSLGATRRIPQPGSGSSMGRGLVQSSSTEQLRTIIRYLLDTLLSLLHANSGEETNKLFIVIKSKLL